MNEERENLLDRILNGVASNGSFRAEAIDSGAIDILLKAEKYKENDHIRLLINELHKTLLILNRANGAAIFGKPKYEIVNEIQAKNLQLSKEIANIESQNQSALLQASMHREARADSKKSLMINTVVAVVCVIFGWFLSNYFSNSEIEKRDIKIQQLEKQINPIH